MFEVERQDIQIIRYFPLFFLSKTRSFRNKVSNTRNISVFDAGCGTNVDVPYFFSLLSEKSNLPNYHLYEVDKNIYWLNILEKRIVEENIERNFALTFVNAKFEKLFIKVDRIFGDPAEKRVIKNQKFEPHSIDLLFMYSNMLYWLDFFDSDSSKAIKNLIKLLKKDGLLIVVQREGQPLLDEDVFLDYSLDLVESFSINRHRNPFNIQMGISKSSQDYHIYIFKFQS